MAGCFDFNRKEVFLAMWQCLLQHLGHDFIKRTMLTSRLVERGVKLVVHFTMLTSLWTRQEVL